MNEVHITFGQIEVLPETVCEYIGQNDKNGVRIFEGDKVKTKYGRICLVKWLSSPCFNGWNLEPLTFEEKAPDEEDLWLAENLEVVGTICEGN